MRRLRVGCLPVVDGDRLVGIITDEDFMDLASKLLEEQIGGEQLSLVLDQERVDPPDRVDGALDASDDGDLKTDPNLEPLE
jgi:CBS domain-containing protein